MSAINGHAEDCHCRTCAVIIELRPDVKDKAVFMLTEAQLRSRTIRNLRDEVVELRAKVARKDAIIAEQELKLADWEERAAEFWGEDADGNDLEYDDETT